MRKVLFKKWIPKEYTEGERGRKLIDGTGKWEDEFTHEGLFHHWGNEAQASPENYGNFTIALVELPNGEIEKVLPENLKFIDPPVTF